MATYWENSCSFGLRYVSWYKYLIVSLVFSHLGFWIGNLFLIAPFPDLCLLVPCRASHRVILGDFNLREINWVTETSNVNENHIDTKFLEAVRDYYLFQHVKQVTRTRENQQDSLLDLILTNEENMIDNIRYLPPLGKSDHLVIQFSLITYINRFRTQTEKFNFFKGNYDQLRTNLRNIAWD